MNTEITLDDLADRTAMVTTATERRDTAIVDLALRGVPRAELCRVTGLSDDRVREIERTGGVPPRKRGPRPKA